MIPWGFGLPPWIQEGHGPRIQVLFPREGCDFVGTGNSRFLLPSVRDYQLPEVFSLLGLSSLIQYFTTLSSGREVRTVVFAVHSCLDGR